MVAGGAWERMIQVPIPPTLLQEIDALVQTGAFSSREVAISELLRLGLDVLKARSRPPRGPGPMPPPMPSGVGDPHADDPISVDPRDTKWM